MNLAEFGTEKFPLRPSNLRKIVTCSVETILEAIGETVDSAGAGAETGSITHAAVEAFHREQRSADDKVIAGLQALSDATKRFPLGDEKEATLYFTHYQNDPRNKYAEFLRTPRGELGLEIKLSGSIPAHSSDPTGSPIYIEGTADQLRRYRGKNCVMDYKTGKTSAWEMQSVYAYQLAAYLHIARDSGYPIEEAYIIRGYRYRERGADLPSPEEAFVAMPFTWKETELILDRVRIEVAKIRSGELSFGPSPMCSWCSCKGLSNCIPLAKKRLGVSA